MDARIARGADEFNGGRFFRAHELWEEVWDESVGPEKLLLQGLVQVAAGYAKIESGIRGGGLKLLTQGLERLRPFLPAAMGVHLTPFLEGVAADVQRLRSAAEASVGLDLVRVPVLLME